MAAPLEDLVKAIRRRFPKGLRFVVTVRFSRTTLCLPLVVQEKEWLFFCRLCGDGFASQTAKFCTLQQQTLNRLVDAGLISGTQAAGDVSARATVNTFLYGRMDGALDVLLLRL